MYERMKSFLFCVCCLPVFRHGVALVRQQRLLLRTFQTPFMQPQQVIADIAVTGTD